MSYTEKITQGSAYTEFKIFIRSLDFRLIGLFHCRLSAPDGYAILGKFVYRKIITPEKLVFVSSFSDQYEGLARHVLKAK